MGEEVVEGGGLILVTAAGDVADGFMEHKVDGWGGLDDLAV